MIDIAHNSTYVIAYGLGRDIDTVEALWLVCAPPDDRMTPEHGSVQEVEVGHCDTLRRLWLPDPGSGHGA